MKERHLRAGDLFGPAVAALARRLGRKPTAAEKERLFAALEAAAHALPDDASDDAIVARAVENA